MTPKLVSRHTKWTWARVAWLVFVVLVVGVSFTETLRFWKSYMLLRHTVTSLEDNSKLLKLQVENLKLMSSDGASLLRLEEELLATPAKDMLGQRLPYLAVKMIEQTKLYRNDGLELSLLLAMIEVESGFNPKATSTVVKGGANIPVAYGLMQTVRSTAKPYLEKSGKSFSPETLYNPETSVEIGCAYLVDLHRGYIDRGLEDVSEWHLSIDSYYNGERVVLESLSGSPLSRSYWTRVRQAQMRWRNKGF